MGEPDYRRAKIVIILVVLAFLAMAVYVFLHLPKRAPFKVVFFNVGQGDAALIRFPDGAKMLVDCGPDRSVLNKLGRYLPFYDRTIDYLLVTHPDLDHYGGCVDVLKRYAVKNIITNGEEKSGDSYWQVWQRYSSEEGAKIEKNSAPMKIEDGEARLEFFSPDPAISLPVKTEGNNQSIVFRLAYGTTTVFFAADMESPLEDAVIALYCSGSTSTPMFCPRLSATYLKVAHHGSDSSSDELFLSSVKPKIGIISVGKNSYGHPSLRVLKKLERAGIQIWRTDELNDIIVK